MKKSILLLASLALALVSCEDITENYEDPAQQLNVTSNYVIFDAAGGTKTVLVTSTVDWTCSSNASWFSVTTGNGSIEIAADANASGQRQDEITIMAVYGGLSETISVAQLSSEDCTDLSAGETANSYIAYTGASYRFNATVKGNGRNSDLYGISGYADACGLELDPDEIVYADLLWESAMDGDKTRSCNIIDGIPLYSEGYVYFKTGTAEGNALIAVKDAQGTVLWSWHIWVCDSVGETYGNGYYWQDRNLGATSNEPGDIANRGLLYQWGRKDPFLPSLAEYGADDQNVLNYQVGDGSGAWNYTDYTAAMASEAPGNIPLAVKYPMRFLRSNAYTSVSAWYLSSSNTANMYCNLWGDSSDLSTYVKSVFDPCPPGYNVPVQYAWGSSFSSSDWTAGDGYYGRYWTAGGNAYYPAAGVLDESDGLLKVTGVQGYYWSSYWYSSSYAPYLLMFSLSTDIGNAYSDSPYGFSVRCMRVE